MAAGPTECCAATLGSYSWSWLPASSLYSFLCETTLLPFCVPLHVPVFLLSQQPAKSSSYM